MFSSEGSGWILDTLEKLILEVARFNPINGSSNIPLPPFLARNRFVLNIKNYTDHNRFNCCFSAAFHLKHGPSLDMLTTESKNALTGVKTYKQHYSLPKWKLCNAYVIYTNWELRGPEQRKRERIWVSVYLIFLTSFHVSITRVSGSTDITLCL